VLLVFATISTNNRHAFAEPHIVAISISKAIAQTTLAQQVLEALLFKLGVRTRSEMGKETRVQPQQKYKRGWEGEGNAPGCHQVPVVI
jgi:hypothetical protein